MNFFNLYKIYKNRINKKLYHTFSQLPFQKSNLIKSMKYSTLSDGKRLRSCLVYVTGKTFGVNIITLDAISIAIECIHSYSLIHDDLPCMDDDNMRRGQSSCHIKYGENIALLAGDSLQTLAFNVLSKSIMPNVLDITRLNMISELSNSIGVSGMCMGQMLDVELKKKKFDLSKLENINLYKTAFLMRSSVRLAYLSSNNYCNSIISILDNFSTSIGLAFQIQDDISDLQDEILKKNDNIKYNYNFQKNCYPLKINFKKSQERIKKLYQKAFFALDELKKKDFNTDILVKLTQFIIKNIK